MGGGRGGSTILTVSYGQGQEELAQMADEPVIQEEVLEEDPEIA